MRNKIPHLFPLVNLKIKDNSKGFSRGKQKLIKGKSCKRKPPKHLQNLKQNKPAHPNPSQKNSVKESYSTLFFSETIRHSLS